MDENERKKKAIENFSAGYNCTQAVVLAFADLMQIERETLLKTASSFGGGMGRLREVCGAMSGIAYVLGALYGYSEPSAIQEKAKHYARVQELSREFEAEFGSIVCRKLLGITQEHDVPIPEKRTSEYYKKRPCKEIVGKSAEILGRYIAKNPISEK